MTKKIAISTPLFNREDFLKLTTTREKNEYLRGVNLIGVDLTYLNLAFMDLSGLDLREADLTGADLREADLTGAKLHNHKIATISGYRIHIFESYIRVGLCYFFTLEHFLFESKADFVYADEEDKEFFIQNKEEIIKLIQEFNLNKGD